MPKVKKREDQSAQIFYIVNGVLDQTPLQLGSRDLRRGKGQTNMYYSLPGFQTLMLYQPGEECVVRDADKGTEHEKRTIHMGGNKCS